MPSYSPVSSFTQRCLKRFFPCSNCTLLRYILILVFCHWCSVLLIAGFFFFIHFIPISLTYRARIFVFYILWERFPFPFPAPDLIPHINLCEYKFAVCQQSVCLIRFLLLGYPKTLCPVLAMFSLDSRPRLLLRMSLAAVFLCVQLLAWLDFIRRERRCVFFIRFFSSVFGICNILRLFSRNKKN